ncbi:nucleotidyltransferase domain-containing protein [Pantoea coffeiphila]|uniref:nucleotidyltransferase domain-containing protein n=1 Tax=Pantoea coffeiphila TaxID=1465635 RepID=UPI001960ECA0|nr:putative nucleotidyltransferase [Pantoea coffeiphila]
MMEQTISREMRGRILATLEETEAKYGVRILYACESGSRGWGFASPDSDYDVRFIYVHQPEWYLRVMPPRDVIEMPIDDELDVCGWELRKTLGLMQAANPTLMEWLDSPIVYRQHTESSSALQALARDYCSDRRARYHYLSMARKNFRGYLQGEQVRLKKYFYVLRPLLAVMWIEAGLGTPPMRFDKLVAGTVTEPKLLAEIESLLVMKRNANEAEYGPRRPYLHAFIRSQLEQQDRPALADSERRDATKLDRFLHDTVMAQR